MKLSFGKLSLSCIRSVFIAASFLASPILNAEETQCANNTSTQSKFNTFVGVVDQDESAIAINTSVKANDIDSIDVMVYICDGVSKAAWYYGYLTNNDLHAMSTTGKTVHATVNDQNISGTVELPNGVQTTFTAPSATGVAGIYLVEDNKGIAANYSVINASIVNSEVTGSVKSSDNQTIDFSGDISAFGEPSNRSIWIVQSNGDIKGRNGGDLAGMRNGGRGCSIWAWVKGKAFDVDCMAYMLTT